MTFDYTNVTIIQFTVSTWESIADDDDDALSTTSQ